MLLKRVLFIGLFFMVSSLALKAQSGTIRGVIIDDESGETLIGVNVFIEGTTNGTSTDLDGAFSINANAGTYTLICSYVSYATLKIVETKVVSEEVNNLGQIRLKTAAIQTGEVVIVARMSKNNESAMATMQRKSTNVMDGISAQTFKKVGDSDAGAAIKRVTGVTVEGGKYVYVRGLGDRYTKTTLNGMEIPGLDPDRNSIQLDIFPTNLISNISVFKTFTPDLSGDFTGGSIDITTTDFPEEKSTSISASLGYNPTMSLNSDFLSYESSTNDLYGLGANSRELPIDRSVDLSGAQFSDPVYLSNVTKQFDPTMATSRKNSFLNTGISFNSGNQINKEKYTLGYNFATSYSRSFKFYEEMTFSEYATNSDFDKTELLLVKRDSGEVGQEEVFWSAFLNGSIKKGNSSASVGLIHLQNGMKQSSIMNGEESSLFNQPLVLQKHILYYNERSMSNALVSLKHAIPSKKLEFSYKFSPTIARNKEPDFRQTVFAIDEDNVEISGGNGGLVLRVYRDLEEISLGNRFDVKYTFMQWAGEKATLKAGLALTTKNRNFDVVSYRFEEEGPKRTDYTLDPNAILTNDKIFNPVTGRGVRATGVEQKNNIYDATSTTKSAYALNELPINNAVKVVYGARIEQFKIDYTGEKFSISDSAEDIFNDETILDETNFLPSLGFIYALNEKINFRMNYSNTVARPSFKEKSGAVIIDALTGRTFIGNLDLEQTEISNYDIRIEKFYSGGQLISASAFYKRMVNPIEMVAYNQNATSSFTPRNSSDATLYGIELDAKRNLSFIKESLDEWSAGANFTYVVSKIDRRKIFSPGFDGIIGTADDVSEYDERIENKRTGETVDKYRELQGQSPYVVNGFVNYKNDSLGFECNLSYNVQGKRLAVVGISRFANVYEQSFHSLNFKATKKLGEDDRMSLSFGIVNILNDIREKLYESYQAQDQVFTRFSPQRTITFGFSYKL